MKRAFLLIVVPALLVALGFAQTPAASINTDQSNIKGCLGGSDGNYTVVEDGTGHIFKITTNSVDFKQHLGHDVTLIGHRASGASSAAADNSFAVTELNMISEHCAAAAAAPTATVSTPSETTVTPDAAATAPAATISTLPETAVIPAADAASPAATVSTPTETAVTPAAVAAPPAETAVTPPADAAAPVATVTTPSETVSTPAARPQRLSKTPAAVATTPAVTASSSSETASTPAAAATPPAATSRGWSVSFLIAFAVLVIFLGTMVPVFSRWRKRKVLERTGAQNLSFTREASSDQGKSDQPGPRKAA